MFTGIIQTKVAVSGIVDKEAFRQLELAVPKQFLQQLQVGASIAINGTCLTVTAFAATDELGWARFDVIDETLRLTNLAALHIGDFVNFERSLTFGAELGGHILSGHIHAMAIVKQIQQSAHNWAIELQLDPAWLPYVFHKGFIGVDGISLTVGEVTADSFWLHIIPETLAITTLGLRQPGDLINIEIDQQTYTIVQTVERVLQARGLQQG